MKKQLVCYLGFHEWPKWEFDCEMTRTHLPFGFKSDTFKGASEPVTRMKRICNHCGKLQYDIVSS